ncbi:cytochrome P450 [Sphingomonas sp.]|uniref:cytochrome P450 n=1 Tax=Sphingomonas sp. TaxID=28214 RepID=UPI0035C84136
MHGSPRDEAGHLVPPFPDPHPKKSSLVARFFRGWNSWIHVLFDKSYTMKMGEIRLPGIHMYIANELPLVRRIMDGAKDFPKHDLMVRSLEPAIGRSTFNANGDDWQLQREMINPVFQHTALGRTLPLMRDAADDVARRIAAMDLSKPIDVDPLMTHIAADVIWRTLFSVPLDAAGSAIIHRTFNRFQRHAHSAWMLRSYRLPTLGAEKRAQKAATAIHAVFADIVRARYDRWHRDGERVHEDILQGLLEAKHPETGEPFTYQGVMEQVSLIFLAGHETSASLMAWALYCLAADPDTQSAMRAEAEEATGGGPLTAEALRRMALDRNVVRETLRLYPPVSFLPREVVCPVQMRDKNLEPGAMLVVAPWLIQRNRDNWACPHSFDPDRFETAEGRAMMKDAWLPFGSGPRICVGAGFATQEAMVVLATLVRAFDLQALADDVPEPISRLTLRPKDGIRLRLAALG